MMYTSTNLIEDIRTALAYSELTSPDKLAGYARQYAEECTKLNDRLKQCLPHLRSGNIAEAVRLAEASPSVTEMFNLLDFENRQDWVDICDGLAYDVPPPLAVEVFQELNDAYLQMTSLEPLLKRHRLYALNNSPIRERLAVLRSIAKADPMTLHWQTDQETFEKARINELRREVDDAIAKNDTVQMQELHRELTAPGWLVEPPQEYRLKICTAVLEKHADELTQYFSAFDYDNADLVYRTMQDVLSSNRMAMPARIERNIRAAVQWLRDTADNQQYVAQYHWEVAQLQEALEVYTPRQDLENLYSTLQSVAVQANRAIPRELTSLYHSRIDSLARGERNRHRLMVTIFGGSILLVAAVVVYALIERAHSEQVNQALATLLSIETENKIDDIERTIQTIRPSIAESPQVAPVIVRLQGILEQDNDRAKGFERYYSQADLLLEQNLDGEVLRAAKAAVDQVDRLKRTPQEITAFTSLRSKYDRLFAQFQLDSDSEFGRLLPRYRQEFNDLPRLASDQHPPGELIERYKTLSENIRRLLSQHPNISSRQRQEGESLLTAIADRQRSIEQAATEIDAFQRAVSRTRSLSLYRNIFQEFSTNFPHHPAVNDIRLVLQDFDKIQEAVGLLQTLCRSYIDSANDYLQSGSVASNLRNQYDRATALITDIESVFPPAENVLTLANMRPIDNNTFRTTEELLRTVARRDLYPWIDENGHWYYLTSHPIDDAGRVRSTGLTYVTTLIAQPKPYRLTSNTPRDLERNRDNYDLLQSHFSRDALIQLDRLTTAPGMRQDAPAIIGELLVEMNSSPGIDPILKIVFLHSFISDYSRVDPIFAENYSRVAKLIDDGEVDITTNWMDVESRSIVPQRQRARVILSRLTGAADLHTLAVRTARETNEFRQQILEATPKFEFIGLLARQDGRWTYLPIVAPTSESGKLFVLRVSNDRVQPMQVGTVSNGRIVLNNVNALQGSPVFFVNF